MRSAASVCALLLVACAGPPYQARPGVLVPASAMVYEGATGPLSYAAATSRGKLVALREVAGESCQTGLALPTGLAAFFGPNAGPPSVGAAWGNGGYAKAMADAQAKAPEQRLFDVRADVRMISVLGIYRRQCLQIHASVAP